MDIAIPLAKRALTLLAHGYTELESPTERASDVAVRATLEALARGETHYTDRPGILPLREGVTKKLNEHFGVTVNPEANAVITCGATEARFVAVQELLASGETLYAGTAPDRLFGALMVRGAGLAETPEGAGLLYLSSNMSEDEQRELLGHISDTATVVFEIDETATTFHPAQLDAFRERTVTIGDLGTEDGLGGWRVGFLAAPRERGGLARLQAGADHLHHQPLAVGGAGRAGGSVTNGMSAPCRASEVGRGQAALRLDRFSQRGA